MRTLSPDNALMIFVDEQTGLMLAVESLDPRLLKQNIIALVETAKIYGLPVVLTASDPSNPQGPGPMIPELTDIFPETRVIDRTSIGAWSDSRITEIVKKSGRKKLIVSGIATDAGVAFTAIDARLAGYDVYVVTDASATWSANAETSALMRMSAAGIILVSWVAVAAELQADWGRPKSEALADLLKRHITPWGYVAAGKANEVSQ